MSEGGGKEVGVSVVELHGDGVLAFRCAHNFGCAERDVHVIMTVPVHQGLGVRGNFDCEDADLIVNENPVMVWFGCDFDFGGWSLRDEEQKENGPEFHG